MPSFTVFKGSESGAIKKDTTQKPELQDDQVLLKVTASGLCGTDEHYRTAGCALGHEGVGVIQEVGPNVKYMKKGDRVGWGYEHDSCGHCQQCLMGTETYCPERKMYGMADLDQGSFAHGAVWKESFLFPIPDGISDEDAAPLMCGGATVFNALRAYDAQPTECVGIVGVGGLGHLAIQYAAKMGQYVVVFSGSDSKKDEALRLGANEFIATKDKKEISASRPVDRLLVTTSAQPDWSLLVPALAPKATVHPLSVAGGDFSIPYMPLILQGIAIQGSVVAPRHLHNKMIQFSAQHGIKPVIQKYPMTEQGITQAMDDLDGGKVHFRAVLIPENN
ncbi:hypothetical protein MBLNU230_g3990t1 [Neophaeotheca triangularis]